MDTQVLVSLEYTISVQSVESFFVTESPDEYLQKEIFPTLLPAMEEMLRVAMATEVSANHC